MPLVTQQICQILDSVAHNCLYRRYAFAAFDNVAWSSNWHSVYRFRVYFEGLKAYQKEDGTILLFRPKENALRMKNGAERMCMPSPMVDQFVEAVKATVLANKRWVPPPGKGSLYIRPLLMGNGAVLGLSPSSEYTVLIYVSPVGNYFKEGIAPINLIVVTEMHWATPGGMGGVKTIGNYASVLKAQSVAKSQGYTDVLYLDCINKKYLEEVSSSNVFIVKGNVISTPPWHY